MKVKFNYERLGLMVPCPHCKAKCGATCRRPSGRPYRPLHDARLMLVQQARELVRQSVEQDVVIAITVDGVEVVSKPKNVLVIVRDYASEIVDRETARKVDTNGFDYIEMRFE